MEKHLNTDTYISNFHVNIQVRLTQLRNAIKEAAPEAEEVISYNMPAFRQNGVLVYFAAYKNHIGFYPTGKGIEAFKDRLAEYKWSKGAIQFPNDNPLPLELIKEIVSFRVEENMQKTVSKKTLPQI